MIFKKIRNRLLVLYLVPFALAFGILGYAGYYLARQALDEEFSSRLTAAATGAAMQIDGRYLSTFSPGDEESRFYVILLNKLQKFRRGLEIDRIYLLDRTGKIILDSAGAPIGSSDPRASGDRFEIERAFGGSAAAGAFFYGNDGLPYKAGYAPVYAGSEEEGQGQVVAVAGAEASVRFFDLLYSLRNNFALLALLGLLGVSAMTVFVSRQLTAPLGRLVAAANRIGGGDMETPVPGEGADEIGVLASNLESMRVELVERERELKMMMHGIAHEVRNPLGGIELFAGLLAEELEGDERKLARVARIRREIGNLNRLVGEFLDFARQEQLLIEETDLRVWLEETVELARPNAEKKGIVFEVEYGATRARFDRQKMKAALLNVLRNAVAASPDDATVNVCTRADDGGLWIEVIDKGEGFSEQSLGGAFRPFFTTRQQGSGLGLAFAKKIAEAHLGRIEAGNRASGGARVAFWIPEKDE